MDADKTWIVVGDIHEQIDNFEKIPELDKASAVIVSGDLTLAGGIGCAKPVMEVIDRAQLPVYVQIGNMDLPEVNDWLDTLGQNLHAAVYELAPGIAIFGIGGSTITPFHTPSEFNEKDYTGWLNDCWTQASRYPHQILVSHNPPKDTKCDVTGTGLHVGSEAVREFIEKHQPDLCICGHIHEAKAEDRIGRTRVLNPGMLSDGGYVVITEKDGQLNAEIRNLA